jgi:CRP/FNR family cyclic AMP-dependent transcriptional regulator
LTNILKKEESKMSELAGTMQERVGTAAKSTIVQGGIAAFESDAAIASVIAGMAGREVLSLTKGESVFVQGSTADSIYFIQKGKVKVSVVSIEGREAVVTLLAAPAFVGEECLAGQALRSSSATTLEPSTVFRVRKQAMLQGVHNHPELYEMFLNSLLSRATDLEEDLCNQLFNVSEKRLAWILIKLARATSSGSMPDVRIPRLSHETLAEMVGTTRSRTSHFMSKFRALDLIEYDGSGEITVRTEMLADVVLNN